MRGILKVADRLVHAGGVETAARKAGRAEADTAATEDRARGQKDKVRARLAGISHERDEARGDLREIGDELQEAPKEALALRARDAGDSDLEGDRDDLRKRATALERRLDATGQTVGRIEAEVKGAGAEAKELDRFLRLVDELDGRLAALHQAVDEAGAVEEEVDDFIAADAR